MNFLDPNAQSIEQKKLFGIWPDKGLPAYGMFPYIKRLHAETIHLGRLPGPIVGVFETLGNGEVIHELFEKFKGDMIVLLRSHSEYEDWRNREPVNQNLAKYSDKIHTISGYESKTRMKFSYVDFMYATNLQEANDLYSLKNILVSNGLFFFTGPFTQFTEFRKSNNVKSYYQSFPFDTIFFRVLKETTNAV